MREAVQWMESYRDHWERRFDGLDDYLREKYGRASNGRSGQRARKKK